MASLLSALPAPRQHQPVPQPVKPAQSAATSSQAVTIIREPPRYLSRKGWIPRKQEDFGDGGAYPECLVAQYPLDMGRESGAGRGKTVALSVDAEGHVSYDAIIRQGINKGKVIESQHKALVPKVDKLSREALAKPDKEQIEKTKKETQEALERVINNKLAVNNPAYVPAQPGQATLIKYTPAQQGPQWNSGASQRIIKMQDMPVDPLEPPKFRHTKVPRGNVDAPVPVMHSPPKPVTKEDQDNWRIPPCISSWKNPKGHTIPLDKRLAADGRGLQSAQINDKFASMAAALTAAEAKARETLAIRAAIQKEIAAKEKMRKETEMRELALRARQERGGGYMAARAEPEPVQTAGAPMSYPPPPPMPGRPAPEASDDDSETEEDRQARLQRQQLMEERKRERERERRLEAKEGTGSKRSKLTRDRDRDVSEKVALGMAHVNAGGEVMYDQRLFNQESGLASGFGNDDAYNMYDKPLFNETRTTNLFRPSKNTDDEQYGGADGNEIRTDRFKADKGFQGADVSGATRGGPVEFERQNEEADPFGLDQFLAKAKGDRRR